MDYQPLKIGHFCSALGRVSDGASRCALQVANQQALMQHEVTVFSIDSDLSELEDAAQIQQVRFNQWFRPKLKGQIGQQIRNLDVMHIHAGVYCLRTYFFSKLVRQLGIPYVYSPQGALNVLSTSANDDFKKKIYRKIFAIPLFNDAAWVQIHAHQEEALLRSLRITAPVKVFPNGVEQHQLARQHELLADKRREIASCFPIRLGYLGRIDMFKKGIDRLISGVGNAAKKLGPNAVELKIAGPDWYEGIHQVNQLAATHGVVDNVKHVGELGRNDLQSFFSSIDFLLIPSRYEGFPLVFSEACVHGCPSIVAIGSNVADYVRDHQVGFVLDDFENGLGDCLATISDDDQGFQRLCENAADFAQQIDWHHVARDIVEAYPVSALSWQTN